MMIHTKSVEELFLKIFKVTVLVIMSLALVAVLILLVTSIYQYSQSPKEPAPAQKAKVKEIRIDDLKNFLIEKEKEDSNKGLVPQQQPAGRQTSLRFLEEATAIFRCAIDFGKKSGAGIVGINDAENAKLVEDLRGKIERLSEDPLRGEPWVKAAQSFICMALADTAIIDLKMEQKIKRVFWPVLEFHLKSWDRIQSDKLKFERQEENRVASERSGEALRVMKAKAFALTCLIAAGSAFALFMMLALYLLVAKIENNLRDINETMKGEKAVKAQ
jgi:hypothetical protein